MVSEIWNSIAVSLIGILVLVYITSRISKSNGHEITRQRRDVSGYEDKTLEGTGQRDLSDLKDLILRNTDPGRKRRASKKQKKKGSNKRKKSRRQNKGREPKSRKVKQDSEDKSNKVQPDHIKANRVYHDGVASDHSGAKADDGDVDQSMEADKQKEGRKIKTKQLIDHFMKENPKCPVLNGDEIESFMGMDDTAIPKILEGMFPCSKKRKKRFVTSNENLRWTKAIVPYVVDQSLGTGYVKAIMSAQTALEKNTCAKFVPWENAAANTDYGLGHPGYLNYIDGGGCWSYVGNIKWATGQPISCCASKYAAIHEIGHAFGLGHEHQSPESDIWTRVNWNNIQTNRYNTYSQYRADTQLTYGHYDTMSRLHYGKLAFSLAGKITWISLFPELEGGDNTYYEYYDIAVSHDCRGVYCSDFQTTCENDGYTSVLDGECTCMCPYGLNRTTGCRTTITEAPADQNWPGGSYSLIASIDGCPATNVFSQGEITHWSNSNSSHSSQFHLEGDYNSRGQRMQFCTVENRTSSVKWPAGVYCLNSKGGSCPYGFDEGNIVFDDKAPSSGETVSTSGIYPDGVFGDDTRLNYCCRDDGFIEEDMYLPNKDPFVLLMYGAVCQPVRGMLHTAEYYVFTNEPGTLAGFSGSHPTLINDNQKYKIMFCYYTPLQLDCGGAHALSSANPSVVITSPNYPSAYSSATECNWLITVPEGSTILLNFDDFHVEESGDICWDYLEIRHALLGQPGREYCGYGFDNSIMSILNVTSITFRSDLTQNWKGFNLTASVVSPADLCYDAEDHGKTYRGTVNFTRDMEPCLPWIKVPHCRMNPFDSKYFRDGLDGNYCRNPGNGLRPWCYTGYDPLEGCLRNYCDVCLKEKIHDTVENCEELTNTTSGFCDHDSNAFRDCAKTCLNSFHLPTTDTVSEISCDAPTIPSDGVLISEEHSSYAVGDSVVVGCFYSGDNVTARCMTDKSWNLGPFVCGICPDGWSKHGNGCYRHFKERLTYADATARCEEYGGKIAPTKTQNDQDFVVSMRPVMTAPLWLGAEKIETVWKWQVDSTIISWSNWLEGQPDNPNDHCACIAQEDIGNKWKDELCTMLYEFVCMKDINSAPPCVDRRSDCQDVFENNPRFREDFSDFALHECFETTGYCNDFNINCTVPKAPGTAVKAPDTVGGYINKGAAVNYECLPEHEHQQGDLIRGCRHDGTLTGDPPVCTSAVFAVTPLSDFEIIARDKVGENKKVYLGPSGQLQVFTEGEISQWVIHSNTSGTVSLQIWTYLGDSRYKFVGQNVFLTAENTLQTFDVPKTSRIPVTYFDNIGVFYPAGGKGVVTYDYCNGSEALAMKSVDSFDAVTEFVKENSYEFDVNTLSCRVFSINAMISPVATYVESNDRVIEAGDRKGTERRVFTGTTSDLQVSETGTIAGWIYNCFEGGSGAVAFQVYHRDSDTRYTLKGQNVVNAVEGTNTVSIPEQDRIAVQAGDLLGLHYSENRGKVTMNNCDYSEVEGEVVLSTSSYNNGSMTIGTQYTFYAFGCKRFNWKAVILPNKTSNVVNGIDRKVLIATGFNLQFSKTGNITAWHYYSEKAGDVAFQGWRRNSDISFTFLGQNLIRLEKGMHTIQVPEEEIFTVQEGDLLGVYYCLNRAQVTMDECDDPSEGTVVQTTDLYHPSNFTVGSAYVFGKYASCHRFNVNTTMTVSEQPVTGIDKKVLIGQESAVTVPIGGVGIITSWHYHSSRDGYVAFQIWREVSESYTFVGQSWTAVVEGMHTIELAEQDSIGVHDGDVIGVYYGPNRGQVTMGDCDDPSEGIVVQSTAFYNHNDFTVGSTYSFSPYIACKRFNINATVTVTVTGIDRKVLISSESAVTIPTGGGGNITAWHYQSRTAGDVAFQVWRVLSGSYVFVGQSWTAVEEGIHTIELAEQDSIMVQDGDVVGVYYGTNRGQVTMGDCDDPSEGTVVQSTAFYNYTDFTEGSTYDFSPYMACKSFNVNTTVIVESNNVTIEAGNRKGWNKKVFTGSISDLYIPADGQIVRWNYHCLKTGPVAFQIWHKISETSFTFAGQNSIQAIVGFNSYTVAEDDRITVKQGDYIGIYYPPDRAQVSMFNCDSDSEGNVVYSTAFYENDAFVEGVAYAFGPSIICKRFNVKAIIQLN